MLKLGGSDAAEGAMRFALRERTAPGDGIWKRLIEQAQTNPSFPIPTKSWEVATQCPRGCKSREMAVISRPHLHSSHSRKWPQHCPQAVPVGPKKAWANVEVP